MNPLPRRLLPLLVASCALFHGCGDAKVAAAPTAGQPAAAQPSDPKSVIAFQVGLLKAGDVAGLRAGMTSRVRDGVTQELVDKAKGEANDVNIDELVHTIEPGTDGPNKTAKIKMKTGRTLTTLIEVDGKWLADTIWFK
jgi:hypothetical protein